MQLSNEFCVMSYNVRVAVDCDGINRFEYRKPKIQALLEQEHPDLIGFQETVPCSREWLRSTLFEDYDLIGCGRDCRCGGEGCTIAFRRDRLSLISLETFWYSETPEVPGSRFEDCDQSKYPRLAHIAVFKPVSGEGFLRFINTHLDHTGSQARARELALLESRMVTLEIPSVLTGDFNAKPRDSEISAFTERLGQHGWSDATAELGGTFHDWGRCNPPIKIDYIYTNCRFHGSRVLESSPEDGVYDSDHYAVMTTVEI